MFTPDQLSALSTLIAGHRHRLVNGKVGWVDLRDLDQEAWLAACRQQHKWDGKQKLVTFHYLRTRGAMIDYLRKTFGATRKDRTPRPEHVSLDALHDLDERFDLRSRDLSPLDQLIAKEVGL